MVLAVMPVLLALDDDLLDEMLLDSADDLLEEVTLLATELFTEEELLTEELIAELFTEEDEITTEDLLELDGAILEEDFNEELLLTVLAATEDVALPHKLPLIVGVSALPFFLST